MITPKININGTSAQDLIDPRQRAWQQIDDLIDTLQQVLPHGRDYPGDAVACTADRWRHRDRIVALRQLQDMLLREALAIREQEI